MYHTAYVAPEMFGKIYALWEQLPEPRPTQEEWLAYCSQVPWERVTRDPIHAANCAKIMAQLP